MMPIAPSLWVALCLGYKSTVLGIKQTQIKELLFQCSFESRPCHTERIMSAKGGGHHHHQQPQKTPAVPEQSQPACQPSLPASQASQPACQPASQPIQPACQPIQPASQPIQPACQPSQPSSQPEACREARRPIQHGEDQVVRPSQDEVQKRHEPVEPHTPCVPEASPEQQKPAHQSGRKH
ncbi:uncharacterized protein LOC144753400 [Lissotriton helveticus]